MQRLNGKNLIEFGEFQLDAAKNVLRRDGEVVSLPLKAVELLGVLIENRGDVVTKDELMARVWADAFVEDSVLTQNIYLLRKTLEANGSKGLIKTIPRRGYLFNGEVRPVGLNGSAAIIERHVLEKISLDLEEESTRDERKSFRPASGYLVLASVLVLLIAGTGVYLYRYNANTGIVSGAPPLRLKPPTNASGFKSLAVLPFRSTDEALAQTFASDLAIRLGSMNKFALKTPSVVSEHARLGAELKADYILSGEVKADGGVFSADVKFADASGSELWSDSFEFGNMIQLQDAIANRSLKEVAALLTEPERELIARRLPSNLSAYENFQTGYELWRRRADGSAHLKRAVELDQSFAPAYAILANVAATSGLKDSPAGREAEIFLEKAFALDPNLPDAHAVQGFIRIFHHRDWPGAETSLKNALELDPNNVNAHHWLGVYYSIHRRLDEAKAEMQTALALDPTNPTLLADIGQLHYFARENETAREYCSRALAITPGHGFAQSYLALIAASETAPDREVFLQESNHAVENDSFTAPYLNVDPRYEILRNDPRFQEVLRRMNL